MWDGHITIAKRIPGDEFTPGGREAGIEVRLEDGRLSICGVVGHPRSLAIGECDTAGQCIEAIESIPPECLVEGWDAERLAKLVNIWRGWHLNDMQAGCEHQRAAGWNKKPIDPSKPTDTYGTHYPGQRHPSWNMLAWVRPDEHPEGLLGKACGICGYRYGTAWLSEDLPEGVVAFAEEIIEEGKVPA